MSLTGILSIFFLSWVFTVTPVFGQEQKIPIHDKPLAIDTKKKKKVQNLKPKTNRSVSRRSSAFDFDDILEGSQQKSKSIKSILDIVEATATLSDRDPTKLLKCKVVIKNNSDMVLNIRGDFASANLSNGNNQCESMSKVIDKLPGNPSKKNVIVTNTKNSITAFASVGSIPAIKDYIQNRGDIRKRYGFDQLRREEQFDRFGDRVLYPGDSSAGYVYFSSKANRLDSITIPISDFYDSKNKTMLLIKLKN